MNKYHKLRKKYLNFKFIFTLITIFASLFLAQYWISNENTLVHMYNTIHNFSVQFKIFAIFQGMFSFWISLGTILSVFLFSMFKKDKYNLSLKISPFFIFCIFMLFNILLYSLNAYIKIQFPEFKTAFDGTSFVPQMTKFISVLSLQTSWIIFFSTFIYLLGHLTHFYLFKKKSLPLSNLNKFLLYCGLGLVVLTSFLFILASLSSLKILYVALFFILILFLNRKEFIRIIKLFFTRKKISFSTNNFSFWFVSIALLFLSFAVLNSLYPLPHGHDDAAVYLNNANLLSVQHKLVSGDYPYTYSLLASVGYLITHNALLAFGLNIIYAILGFLTLYSVLQMHTKNNSISLSLSTLWLSLPMTQIFLHFEAKVELLLFFITSIALLFFSLWVKNSKNMMYLFYMITFLFFSFTVKILSAFLIVALFPIIIFLLIKNKDYFKKTKIISLTTILFLVIVSPWVIYNLSTSDFNNLTISSFVKSTNKYSIMPDFEGEKNLNCTNSAQKEDLERFEIKSPTLLKPIIVPWKLTLNNNTLFDSKYTGIGFVFFIFYVLFFVFLLYSTFSKKRLNSEILFVAIPTLIFWVLWSFFGRNIIWYGYSGFALFILLCAFVLRYFKSNNKSLFYFLISLILLNVFLHFSIKSSILLSKEVLDYASARKYSINASDIINQLNKETSSRIYTNNLNLVYYVKNNNHRFYNDPGFDKYYCTHQNYSDEFFLNYIKKNNIDYIVILLANISDKSNLNDLSRFNKKNYLFKKFARKNLKLLFKYKNVYLFQVPKN